MPTKTENRSRSSQPATDTDDEPQRRLVVELNPPSAADLAWLQEAEGLNKTTVVNRAIQVYKMVMQAQLNGGSMTIDDPARGAPERVRVI